MWVGQIFFLKEVREVKSQYPLSSLWKEDTTYFCWAALWIFTLLSGNFFLFILQSIYNIFWKARAAAVCSNQLKKPEAHTHLWMKVLQFTVLNQSQRGRSNPKFGFVAFTVVWKAVATSLQVETEYKMRKERNFHVICVHLHARTHTLCFTDMWLQLQHPRDGTERLLRICACPEKERGRFGVAVSSWLPSGHRLPGDLCSFSGMAGFCSLSAVGLFLNAVAKPQVWKAMLELLEKARVLLPGTAQSHTNPL